MKISLNGWQRIWVVVSVILLASSLFVVGVLWPEREVPILENLNSPKCQVWRDLPEGFFPEKLPDWKDECYSLQSFLYYQQVNLKSIADYDKYLVRARVKTVTVGLGVWILLVAIVYLLGWSIGWIAKGFSKKSG
jgi:hypothetical protein